MKKKPSFWWDFTNECRNGYYFFNIIIESDHKDFPILGKRQYCPENIESAKRFIKDLQEGRKDFRRDRWDLT
jgi:hypothetical protein